MRMWRLRIPADLQEAERFSMASGPPIETVYYRQGDEETTKSTSEAADKRFPGARQVRRPGLSDGRRLHAEQHRYVAPSQTRRDRVQPRAFSDGCARRIHPQNRYDDAANGRFRVVD